MQSDQKLRQSAACLRTTLTFGSRLSTTSQLMHSGKPHTVLDGNRCTRPCRLAGLNHIRQSVQRSIHMLTICQSIFIHALHSHKVQPTQHMQHSTAQDSTAQHSTAQHSTAQHSTAQHSTAQHSTAQHSTAQHSTAQHGRARSWMTDCCQMVPGSYPGELVKVERAHKVWQTSSQDGGTGSSSSMVYDTAALWQQQAVWY